jgi:threonine aldolase
MAIDLRSDTVTQPSPSMREAMSRAELGDDGWGEDPTLNRLEAVAADRLGKEAAVFVASGTMGNLSALLAHCERGREAILGDESHIFHYEAGGASALGGIVLHTVPTLEDGTMPLEAVEGAIRPNFTHYAPAGVICLENTHNRCSGSIVGPDYMAGVGDIARRHGLPVHLDGARLFNASVATGLPLTAWTAHATSVQVCLSKGLAAPVGSLVAGSRAFVDRVRRARKLLGGGMRQAGVLAAAGLVALDEMIDRLAEDHQNARILADLLARLPGIVLDPSRVQTNIVVFRLGAGLDAARFVREVERAGVRIIDLGGGRLRAVTHYGISAADCRQAVEACARALISS